MKKKDYGSVSILLAMENPMVRQGLVHMLQNEGFARPTEATNRDRMLEVMQSTTFDLILMSTELGLDFVSPVMGQLRFGEMPHHPLPVVIQFLMTMESDYVRKVIDSGPDDLLPMPISPGLMVSRIAILMEKRKQFIVTSNYVGPDRRTGVRPDAVPIPLIDVPNPLAARKQKVTDDILRKEIDVAAAKLLEMRLARYAYELQWLLRAIQLSFEQATPNMERLGTFCVRIKTLLEGLPRLMPKGLPEKLAAVCAHLEQAADILLRDGFAVDDGVLPGLARVVGTVTRMLRETMSPDLAESSIFVPATGAAG